jgi:hypothetical protein
MQKPKVAEAAPFLDSRIELENDALIFTPEMSDDRDNSLGKIFTEVVSNVFEVAALVGRVADVEWVIQNRGELVPSTSKQALNDEQLDEAQENDPMHSVSTRNSKDNDAMTYLEDIQRNQDIQAMKNVIIEKVGVIMEDSQ